MPLAIFRGSPWTQSLNSEVETNEGKKTKRQIYEALDTWAARGQFDEQCDEVVRRFKDCFDRKTSYLDLSGLGLRSLPILPASLRMLNLNNNRLTPGVVLPSHLEKLLIGGNALESLPVLPESLRHLDARSNLLNSDADFSQLEGLEHLAELNLSDNQLTHIPEALKHIGNIDLQANRITEIVEEIGVLQSTHVINLRGNELSKRSERFIEHAQVRKSLAAWRPDNGQPMLESWISKSGEMKPGWYDIVEAEPKADVFFKFLSRLRRTSNARYTGFRSQVWALLSRMLASPNLCEAALNIAQEATETCSDGVLLTLQRMETACLCDKVREGHYDRQIPELIDAGRQIFRELSLERITGEKIRALVAERLDSPRKSALMGRYSLELADLAMSQDELRQFLRATVDDVQIGLAYRVELRGRLNLDSSVKRMRYTRDEALCDEDMHAAELRVMREENEQFNQWLSKWEPWQMVMLRTEPTLLDEADDAAYFISDDFPYEQIVADEIKKEKLPNEPAIQDGVKTGIMMPWLDDIKLELTEKFVARKKCAQKLDAFWDIEMRMPWSQR